MTFKAVQLLRRSHHTTPCLVVGVLESLSGSQLWSHTTRFLARRNPPRATLVLMHQMSSSQCTILAQIFKSLTGLMSAPTRQHIGGGSALTSQCWSDICELFNDKRATDVSWMPPRYNMRVQVTCSEGKTWGRGPGCGLFIVHRCNNKSVLFWKCYIGDPFIRYLGDTRVNLTSHILEQFTHTAPALKPYSVNQPLTKTFLEKPLKFYTN